MITPDQCRAARGLLNWKQRDLAERAHLGLITVRKFESGKTNAQKSTLHLLRETFEREGIVFLFDGGYGVLRRTS